jgi:hypothetical protein
MEAVTGMMISAAASEHQLLGVVRPFCCSGTTGSVAPSKLPATSSTSNRASKLYKTAGIIVKTL